MQAASKNIVKGKAVVQPIVACQTTSFSEQATRKPQLTMANEETKHRVRLPLYDLMPRFQNNWVAPNSTVGKSNLQLNPTAQVGVALDS